MKIIILITMFKILIKEEHLHLTMDIFQENILKIIILLIIIITMKMVIITIVIIIVVQIQVATIIYRMKRIANQIKTTKTTKTIIIQIIQYILLVINSQRII